MSFWRILTFSCGIQKYTCTGLFQHQICCNFKMNVNACYNDEQANDVLSFI